MSVVFLCVGAAKAGTSWLYRQLAAHPECHFRAIKELHYFDALEAGRLERELRKHRGEQEALLARVAGRGPDAEQARRLRDRADWLDVLERGGTQADYLAYLQDGAGEARVVGEITPAYALLPESRIGEMVRLAGDVRLLYLLRDPVERLWSHVRMMAARRDEAGRVTARRAGRILERVFAGEEEQIARRSDYAGALKRLAAAVPGGQLMIEVFEEMIAGEGFQRICAFLGLSAGTMSRQPVHTGQALVMEPVQRQAAADWLAPQYDAAERALGRMPQSWRGRG